MLGLVSRIVLAVIVAAVVGFLLAALLGPLLLTIDTPPTTVLGDAFKHYGWGIGVVAGIWYFVAGGGLWPRNAAKP